MKKLIKKLIPGKTAFLIIMIFIALSPCISQKKINKPERHSISVIRTSFGYSTLSLNNWCQYLEKLKSSHSSIKDSQIHNWGNNLDLGVLIRTSKSLSVGFEITYMWSRMSFLYLDALMWSIILPVNTSGKIVTIAKTNSGLYQPIIAWYLPINNDKIFPYIQAGFGYGNTNFEFYNAIDNSSIEGKGGSWVYSSAIGLEAGKKHFLFHMRLGYRLFNPKINYDENRNNSAILYEVGNTEVNLSGIFFQVGIGFNFTPR